MINIAVCKSRKDKVYKNIKLSYKEFIDKLKTTTYTKETYNDYINMEKEKQDNIKDIGGFVGGYLIDGKRNKKSVEYRSLITLDIDYGYKGMMEYLEMSLDYACIIYTTHKHNPDNERFRIVIPLNRNINNIEYEAISRLIAQEIGIDYFDDTTYESSRLMYFPSTSKDGEFKFINIKEDYIDVDKYLNKYTNYKDKTLWPTSKRNNKLDNLTKDKQQNPLQKDGVIGAFCKTYSITEAIQKYLQNTYLSTTDPYRYTYKDGSSHGGLIIYEDDLFAYSHHSSDPCSNKLCNAFDLVKNHKFKNLEEDKALEKMIELASSDKFVMKTLGNESIKLAKKEFDNEDKDNSNELNEILDYKDDGDLWITKLGVNKNGAYLSTINNIVLILENDINLKGKIALNEFTHQITIRSDLSWRKVKNKNEGDTWCDNDDSNLRHYIEKVYKIKSQSVIYDGISVVANKNSYHPIKEYLNSVKWDGVNRIDNLFIDYLGTSNNIYTKAVARKMLVAAVNRIFNPGIKFDNMAVLVGKQGIGKSHFINLLGKNWYSDSINTVVGKEAYEQLQEAWIVEMAELSATKKAETESVKHFISKREDIYRVAYGRRVEKFKRQCVFFGTTNDYEFLKDKTGNRRFWPIKVGVNKIKKSMFEKLDNYEIDNIWAEAIQLYKNNESLLLTKEENEIAIKCQEGHMEGSPKEGMIREYLDTLLPNNWDKMDIDNRKMFIEGNGFEHSEKGVNKRVKVCAMEIWVELFGGDPKMLSPYNAREINDVLRNIDGWKAYDKGSGKLRFGSMYGSQRAFVLDENIS